MCDYMAQQADDQITSGLGRVAFEQENNICHYCHGAGGTNDPYCPHCKGTGEGE